MAERSACHCAFMGTYAGVFSLADMLVGVGYDIDGCRLPFFLRNGHRHDLLCETTSLLRGYRTLVAAQGVGILIGAADGVTFGRVLRRFTLTVRVMHDE